VDKRLAALLSITGRMDGFLYRCRNDANYTMLYISEGVQRVSGYLATEVLGNKVVSFGEMIYHEDLDLVNAEVDKGLERRDNWNIVYRIISKAGVPIWVREIGGGVFGTNDKLEFLEGFVIDITEMKRLAEVNERSLKELAATNHELHAAKAAAEEATRAADALRIAAEYHATDMEMSRASLEKQAMQTVELAEDLAIQKAEADQARERSEYLANHDILTGLPNRRAFMDRLKDFMAGPEDDGVGLLFIDLDKFKEVNDTLGHEAGDALLVQVADALRGVLREGDCVARLGGDEFAFLLTAPRSVLRRAARSIGQRVLAGLQIAVPSPKGTIAVGCTVGIALAPDDAGDMHELMRRADNLMYVGKKRGRNRLIEMSDVATDDVAVLMQRGAQAVHAKH
jgi:diguanylate cyclase (GGDEF)-like protein/PAS domain S-box-containing protein